jgi:hypothetical protein
MRKVIIYLITVGIFSSANAGFNGLTHHSRANCANNESISWDWTQDRWLFVRSDHIQEKTGHVVHTVDMPWVLTWRNAQVHWGEGTGGWIVHGTHYMKDSKGNGYLAAEETVSDCSIYDGWWDKDKNLEGKKI